VVLKEFVEIIDTDIPSSHVIETWTQKYLSIASTNSTHSKIIIRFVEELKNNSSNYSI
jgi:hypothetical protein